jgi:hypothetical protein
MSEENVVGNSEGEVKTDVKMTKVTEQDVAKLGIILQSCARSGDWTLSGITPEKNCKHCLGTGRLGRNVMLDMYMLCPCILKKIQDAMSFYMKINKLIEEDQKGEENGETKEVEQPSETVTDVEEGKVSKNER